MEHGEINKCLAAAEHIKAVCRDAANELKDVSRHVYDDFLRTLDDDWDSLPHCCPSLTGLAIANMALGHDMARRERAAAPYADALKEYVQERAEVCLSSIEREAARITAHLDSIIVSVQKDLVACGVDMDLGAGMERRRGPGVRDMAGLVRSTISEPDLEPWIQVQDPMTRAVLSAARKAPVGSLWLSRLLSGPLVRPRLTALFWTALRRIVTDGMRQAQEQVLSRCDKVCAAISQEGAAIARDIRAGLPGGDLS